MRKFLTIAAIVIVLLGLAVGIYFLFFNTGGGITTEDGLPNENPFGNGGDFVPDNTPSDEGSLDGPDMATEVAPRLVKITDNPVARGAIALNATTTPVVSLASTTDATATEPVGVEVRYVDRESGNIFSYMATEGTSSRLTNRTIPGVQEASWLPDGSIAYVRYLTTDADRSEHIETYALPVDGSEGYFLSRDLGQVLARSAKDLFTFMPTTSGSIGSVGAPDRTGLTTLFSSSLSALTFSASSSTLAAHTKPSAKLPGYGFIINGRTGAFTKILGQSVGLTTLINPAGTKVLYSNFVNGALQLAVIDVATREVTSLPIQTLTEKCVWADNLSAYCAVPVSFPTAVLPDDWYQGRVSFSDRIWHIDFTARVATLTANLPVLVEDEPIDAISLTLDTFGSTLVFQNKRDSSLWAYSL